MLVVASLFSSATAPLWHHHDDTDHQHPECVVCAVVAEPMSDGLGTDAVGGFSAPCLELIVMAPEAVPVRAWRVLPPARGPPPG